MDKYPPYSGRISEVFETNVNANIQCDFGYDYYSIKQKMCSWVNDESWEIIKICFPDAEQIKQSKNKIMQRMYISSKI